MEARSERLTVRLTPAELDRLRRAAEHERRKVADYARLLLVGGQVPAFTVTSGASSSSGSAATAAAPLDAPRRSKAKACTGHNGQPPTLHCRLCKTGRYAE